TSLSCPTPVAAGTTVSCTTTVTSGYGWAAPSGAMSFSITDGAGRTTKVGSCTLSARDGSSGCGTTVPAPSTPSTTETVTAAYAGDGINAPSSAQMKLASTGTAKTILVAGGVGPAGFGAGGCAVPEPDGCLSIGVGAHAYV